MPLVSFTDGNGRDILEVLQILVDDLSFVVWHRIQFAIDMALGYVDRFSSGDGLDLLVSVFLIMIDIDDQVDSLLESRIDCRL